MNWKFEKEFRVDHPDTIGENDKGFDLDNYKDWLEKRLACKNGYISNIEDKMEEFIQLKVGLTDDVAKTIMDAKINSLRWVIEQYNTVKL